MPLVYDQLHALAQYCFQSERDGHTLRTTALVHEAYLRLAGSNVNWQDRAHFFAVAAQVMRRILVDYARKQKREKRGGGAAKLSLDDAAFVADNSPDAIIALEDALSRLTELDPRKGQALELVYFGGLTYEEAAHTMAISEATLHRDLRMAKAWVHRELAGMIQ